METPEEEKGMTDKQLQDYEDGVKGIDKESFFFDRSKENSDGLKVHIEQENLKEQADESDQDNEEGE